MSLPLRKRNLDMDLLDILTHATEIANDVCEEYRSSSQTLQGPSLQGPSLQGPSLLLPSATFTIESAKEKRSNSWNVMFQQLEEYKREFGNCLVPANFKANPQLGKWVSSQRTGYKNKIISVVRKQKLEAIGFVWSVLPNDSWDDMFEKLVEYKKQHGDCQVPQDYKGVRKLGRWVKEQRFTKDRLSQTRVERLEAIGFVWCPHSKLWDEMYERLLDYKNTQGDCLVPRRFKGDVKLGAWVYTQRYAKKNLSAERIDRLEKIGFVWRVKRSSVASSKRQKVEKPAPVVKSVPVVVKPAVIKPDTKTASNGSAENDSLASLMMGVLREYRAKTV